MLDKGVVTVSPPNNKQATLTLICLFCPSLYLALSRRFATISLSFPLRPFVRRSRSLLPPPSLSSSYFYLYFIWLPARPRKCFRCATFRKLLTNHEEFNGWTIFYIITSTFIKLYKISKFLNNCRYYYLYHILFYYLLKFLENVA